MKDFFEITKMIDKSLPESEQQVMLCDLLLQEFAKMQGKDLAPHLAFFGINLYRRTQELSIRFPMGAYVFDARFCDVESDKIGEIISSTLSCEEVDGLNHVFQIQALRKARGMSQQELAQKLGYKSGAAIGLWEAGVRNPPSPILPLLAQTLGCTIDELYCRGKDPA